MWSEPEVKDFTKAELDKTDQMRTITLIEQPSTTLAEYIGLFMYDGDIYAKSNSSLIKITDVGNPNPHGQLTGDTIIYPFEVNQLDLMQIAVDHEFSNE